MFCATPLLRSLRARLTLWLVILIVLALSVFASFLYITVRTTLTTNLDHLLVIQAQHIATLYDPTATEGGANVQQGEGNSIDQMVLGRLYVEVFDNHGLRVSHSSSLRAFDLPLRSSALLLLHRAPSFYTSSLAGVPLRIYTLPVASDGHVVALVVVAGSLHDLNATLSQVALLLLGGGLGTTILAAAGAGVLVQRGLHALTTMTRLTHTITAQRLGQHLHIAGAPTEVADLALSFNTMLDRLQEAFESQQRFLADAAHELRTPITTILSGSEVVLLAPDLPAPAAEQVTLIRDEAARMGRLVANLLVLARGDAGQVIVRRPIEIDSLLWDVARVARLLARGQAVVVRQTDRPLVQGDADLLTQLLLNLLDNALRATPAEGTITLSLSATPTTAILSVQDTGPGIAAEHLERIFARFARLDEARARQQGGAGLGLAIARWIAHAHGGTLSVHSTVGEGSTFTLALPRSDQPLTILSSSLHDGE